MTEPWAFQTVLLGKVRVGGSQGWEESEIVSEGPLPGEFNEQTEAFS